MGAEQAVFGRFLPNFPSFAAPKIIIAHEENECYTASGLTVEAAPQGGGNNWAGGFPGSKATLEEQRAPNDRTTVSVRGGSGVSQTSGAGTDILARAWTTQSHAADLGFDWDDVSGVLAKVREETDEIETALNEGQSEHAKREMGDLLFATVNLARFLQADPADELRFATDRFEHRFRRVRQEIEQSGRRISDCTLDHLEAVWQRVKRS